MLCKEIKEHDKFPPEFIAEAEATTLKTIRKCLRSLRTNLNKYVVSGDSPLSQYGFIMPNEWEQYKAEHTAKEAKSRSSKCKELNKMNKYKHYMDQAGTKQRSQNGEKWKKNWKRLV